MLTLIVDTVDLVSRGKQKQPKPEETNTMNTSAKIMLKVRIEEAQLKHSTGLITKSEMLALICGAKLRYEKQ